MDYIPPMPETEMHQHVCAEDFSYCPDLAQYKGSDYSNAVRVERGITLERAFEIAREDDEIDYFFYVKGWQMVLEIPPGLDYDPSDDPLELVTDNGYGRIFHHGDVVFFNNEGKWLGTATGLADVYEKQ